MKRANVLYVIVGSKSAMKHGAAKRALDYFTKRKVRIVDCNARSGVPETPLELETKAGAENRAKAALRSVPGADYYVGLESGLAKRHSDIYEEAWCCVLSGSGDKAFGISSAIEVPEHVLYMMQKLNLPHCDIMTLLQKKYKLC